MAIVEPWWDVYFAEWQQNLGVHAALFDWGLQVIVFQGALARTWSTREVQDAD